MAIAAVDRFSIVWELQIDLRLDDYGWGLAAIFVVDHFEEAILMFIYLVFGRQFHLGVEFWILEVWLHLRIEQGWVSCR